MVSLHLPAFGEMLLARNSPFANGELDERAATIAFPTSVPFAPPRRFLQGFGVFKHFW